MPPVLVAVLVAALVLVAGCAGAPAPGAAPQPPSAAPSSAPSPVAVDAPPAAVARAADSQVVPRRPTLVVLPSGARMPVEVAGTTPGGALVVPDDIRVAGWWEGGSRIGDRFGSMVLAAHVDSLTQGLGPVAEMLSASPGDVLEVQAGGVAQRFVLASVTRVARDRLGERTALFSARGPARLVVITCGGPFDPVRGYRDNVVAVAHPVEG